ncbi:MAG: glycosyltransferase family 9 protein [Cytophagales bacterium]|nr:glycosyltransferase family 9 protein [Cytophagales bacterium]
MMKGWDTFRNVLCVRLDNLGDVLMTTPAVRALKEAVPGRKITLLTSKAGSGIGRCVPEIDEVLTFPVPWQGSAAAGSREAVQEMIDTLRDRSFDAAVVFTVYSQNPLPTAMLLYQAGVPRIAGYCRENPYGLMTDWLPDPEPLSEIRHEVTRQLDLVRALGTPPAGEHFSLRIGPGVAGRLTGKLRPLGFDPDRPFLVLHPGVSEDKRQYPVPYFAEAARQLALTLDCQILLTGVASEKPLASAIRRVVGPAALDLTGHLDLDELAALIREADLLIANNTGPVHLAAAVGTPVVVLYALTNPQHTPWQVPYRLLPFDVPPALRSRNTIITYAYEKAFVAGKWLEEQAEGTFPVAVPAPEAVVQAAKELLGVAVGGLERRLEG